MNVLTNSRFFQKFSWSVSAVKSLVDGQISYYVHKRMNEIQLSDLLKTPGTELAFFSEYDKPHFFFNSLLNSHCGACMYDYSVCMGGLANLNIAGVTHTFAGRS